MANCSVIVLCDQYLYPRPVGSVCSRGPLIWPHTHTADVCWEVTNNSCEINYGTLILINITCHSASLRKAPKRRILPLRPAAYVQSVENFFDWVPSTRTSKPSTCAFPSETKILSASKRTALYDRYDGNHLGVLIINIFRSSGITVRDWITSEMRSKYIAICEIS